MGETKECKTKETHHTTHTTHNSTHQHITNTNTSPPTPPQNNNDTKRQANNPKTKANAIMTNQIMETQTTTSRSRFQKTSPRLQREKEIRKLKEKGERTQVTFDSATDELTTNQTTRQQASSSQGSL
jgi:hypothetical protein